MSHLIGICGGSGSGKSTLAAEVVGLLGDERANLLAFDTYYLDHGHLTVEERETVNYDHPDSLDVELFKRHLDNLTVGSDIEAPVYDFATHTRSAAVTPLASKEFTVVEGILLFAFPDIVERLQLRVFRDCPERTRFRRRVRRDIAERGRTADSVGKQFAATVKPMHDRFVQPSMGQAHLILPGDGLLADHASEVVAAIIAPS